VRSTPASRPRKGSNRSSIRCRRSAKPARPSSIQSLLRLSYSRAGYHPDDPRWAAAARFDGREPPRALTSAACLARSADRARLRFSPIRIQRSTARSPEKARLRCDQLAFSPPTSAALRYWDMARQRYCRQLTRYRNTLRVSADLVAEPAAHTRAESRGSRPSKPDTGERQTLAGAKWIRTVGTAAMNGVCAEDGLHLNVRELEKSAGPGGSPSPNLRLTCGNRDPQHSFRLTSRTRGVATQSVSSKGRQMWEI
jgi:hypothetical protein